MLYNVCGAAASALECHVAVRLVHVVDVVLVLHRLSVMLIFEYFCEYALGARGHTRVLNRPISSILDAHSSSMHCVELILHARASRGALAAGGARVVASLGHGGPLDIKLGRLPRYQVLCLITTWLYHQALIDRILIRVRYISADGAGVEGLPGILLVGAALNLAM